MQNNLRFYIEATKPDIETCLQKSLPLAPHFVRTNFNEALQYALFPGGKRLRPVLTLLGAELCGGERQHILNAAAAVEFVHTSSLIFDDLPAMDNAAERRGKTSLHEKFGEGTAVLVGLALLNVSYGLIFENSFENSPNAVRALREIVECVGAAGMIGGQSLDLALASGVETRENAAQGDDFETLRNLKTSALMRMSLRVGAILAGASERQLEILNNFSILLGDAYQTGDDLLDLQEDLHLSESSKRRATLVLEQGVEAAEQRVRRLTEEAKTLLRGEFGTANDSAEIICAMADYIVSRRK